MRLDQNGLKIGNTQGSSNLYVEGNAMITHSLNIGGHTSNSNLHLQGSLGFSISSISDNTSISSHSSYNLIESSQGNIIIELPFAANVTGREYTIKKTTNINKVILKGGGNQIDQVTQIIMEETNQLVSALKVMSDGTQWRILSQPSSGITLVDGYSPSDNSLAVWFDAADRSSIVLNSGNVSQWNDKSGNDDHATQATGNMQPEYMLDSSLKFDGIQSLVASSISNLNTWSSNRTIAMVVSYGNQASNTILHWGAGTSSFRDEQFVVDSSNTMLSVVDGHNQGSPNFSTTSSDTVGSGMVVVYSSNTDGSTFNRDIRINGVSEFSNSSDRTSNISPDGTLHIGQDFDGSGYRSPGSYAKDVYIHEIIIYTSEFSTSELQRIEGYLLHKWDLLSQFQNNHPFYYHMPEK